MAKHYTKKHIHYRKTLVQLRQLYDGRCFYCKQVIGLRRASIDHKMPRSRGGGNELENYAYCCRPCNFAKADMTAVEYLRGINV